MKDALANRPVPRRQLLILIALLGLAVAPHIVNLSLWVTGFYFFLTGIRMLAVRWKQLLPSRITLYALTALSLVNVAMHTSIADGRHAGVSLLVAMTGLKLLELRSRRDVYMVVFLAYFIVITQFLFSQALTLAVFLSILVIALTGLLVAMNRANPKAPLTPAFKQSLRMLTAAVPAMLVMFVLFPRLGGPLWGIGTEGEGATTGMTDKISLGSISQLSQSGATAFRANFDDQLPKPEQRYWRGLVLWQADGKDWTAGATPARDKVPFLAVSDPPITYEITLEPTRQRWLFMLDLPQVPPAGALLNGDLVASSKSPNTRRFTYRTEAWPNARVVDISDEDRSKGLQLPASVTPRMRDLAQQWRQASDQDAGIVDQALAYFRDQPFIYTLSPPTLGARPEDEFLFDTRRGFCEHYATSFTLMMRLAGIPARVVLGYQGGEVNPRSGHLIVRQSDAHAWTEVWISDHGWLRVDPTAAVAPQRIEHSISQSSSAPGSSVIFNIGERSALAQLLREARWLADSFEMGWHRWVIGYSRDRQRGLLSDLGIGGLNAYSQALLAVGLGALAMAAGALFLRLAGDNRKDPVRDAYRRFQWRLRRAGLHVSPWQGPRDLKSLAQNAFPAQAEELGVLFDRYIALRYGSETQERKRIRRFRFDTWRLRLPKIKA